MCITETICFDMATIIQVTNIGEVMTSLSNVLSITKKKMDTKVKLDDNNKYTCNKNKRTLLSNIFYTKWCKKWINNFRIVKFSYLCVFQNLFIHFFLFGNIYCNNFLTMGNEKHKSTGILSKILRYSPIPNNIARNSIFSFSIWSNIGYHN